MGLDQYAYVADKADSEVPEGEEREQDELAYWRKHPNLQGWMERLWRDRGGANGPAGSSFNCVEVELHPEDIDALEEAVNGKELPETIGFFFGSDGDDHYKTQDLEFIAAARRAHDEGRRVFYNSWW
jgi:hypothetical protein